MWSQHNKKASIKNNKINWKFKQKKITINSSNINIYWLWNIRISIRKRDNRWKLFFKNINCFKFNNVIFFKIINNKFIVWNIIILKYFWRKWRNRYKNKKWSKTNNNKINKCRFNNNSKILCNESINRSCCLCYRIK